jgi:tight adherence protein C
MRELALAESASRRVLAPAVGSLSRRLRWITPAGLYQSFDKKVRLAGLESQWPAERVLAVQFLVLAGALLPSLLMIRAQGGAGVVAAVILMWIAIFGPSVVLDRRVAERQQGMLRHLSDALDQITMAVEAGLGLEGALKRVSKAGHGPLSAEFGRVLKEMQIGVSRAQALRHLADRTALPELHAFVIAVIQAEEHGLPIAQVLRVQAADMRVKRRQRAEEKAMRLPVKMIFPLGLCIFPALFIVIMGPGVVRIWRAFAV